MVVHANLGENKNDKNCWTHEKKGKLKTEKQNYYWHLQLHILNKKVRKNMIRKSPKCTCIHTCEWSFIAMAQSHTI